MDARVPEPREREQRRFTETAEDAVRCLLTRLGDAWEDSVSVDLYLWREDCFYPQHLR